MLYKTVSLGFCAATVSGYGVGMSKLSSSKVSRVGTVEMAKKSVSAEAHRSRSHQPQMHARRRRRSS